LRAGICRARATSLAADPRRAAELESGYAAMAAGLKFEMADVHQAARVVQAYIARIDTASR
jgi:hypothetical protein